jgi:hypothetical protein
LEDNKQTNRKIREKAIGGRERSVFSTYNIGIEEKGGGGVAKGMRQKKKKKKKIAAQLNWHINLHFYQLFKRFFNLAIIFFFFFCQKQLL